MHARGKGLAGIRHPDHGDQHDQRLEPAQHRLRYASSPITRSPRRDGLFVREIRPAALGKPNRCQQDPCGPPSPAILQSPDKIATMLGA